MFNRMQSESESSLGDRRVRLPKSELLIWLLAALLLRIIAAWTNLRFGHPDEWHQTVEYANLLVNGVMTPVYEVGAHLRNLTLPILFQLPLLVAKFFHENEPFYRMFYSKLFVGLINLVVCWRFACLLTEHAAVQSVWMLRAILGALFLPWFVVSLSVRTSIEHFSALWFMLLAVLAANPRAHPRRFVWVGLLLALTVAVRYPSALFSLGYFVALLVKPAKWQELSLLVLGLAVGAVAFGLADLAVYGRPWESFWQYVQFNLLTGLSERHFGAQGPVVYLEFVWQHFGGILTPIGLPLLFLGTLGILDRFRLRCPVAWGSVFYFVGHLIPSHKEPRFLIPLLPMILLGAVHAVSLLRGSSLWQRLLSNKKLMLSLAAVSGLSLVANFATALGELRGELFKARSEFFVVQKIVANKQFGGVSGENAGTTPPCALLSTAQILGSFLTYDSAGENMLQPTALLRFPTTSGESPSGQRASVQWIDSPAAACLDGSGVFVHLSDDDLRRHAWLMEENRCDDVALYHWSMTRWLAAKLRSTRLLECAPRVVDELDSSPTAVPLVRNIPRLPRLPPLGISADDFLLWTGGSELLPPPIRTSDR